MKKLTLLACVMISFMSHAQYKYLSSFRKSDNYQAQALQNISLVSFLQNTNQCAKYEGFLSEKIASPTVNAIPTFERISKGGKKLTRDEMVTYLKAVQADGVLMTTIHGYSKSKVEIKLPVVLSGDPKDVRNPAVDAVTANSENFYSNAYPAYQLVGNENYWNVSKWYRLEFVVYNTKTQEQAWVGMSTYLKSSRVKKEINKLIEEVVAALKKDQIIK